jgi:hypothetical protein
MTSKARINVNKLNEYSSVSDFGAIGDDTADDTAALQAAINHAQTTKIPLYIPPGVYKITSTLTVTDDFILEGAGSLVSTIKLYTASATTVALLVDVPNNSSFIGARFGQFRILGNGGSARGIGLRLQTTATNSAISNCVFEHMYIQHVNVGVSMTGVIYMSTFRNITVSGNVDTYGWYGVTAQEIIYNSYEDLEVTNVNNNAYAYYFNASVASQFRNLTADGCCYFAGAYTHVQGLSVEGIYAATPPSTNCVEINQIAALSDVALINIPNSKCSIGINVTSSNTEVSNVRFPDAGAGNQPNLPIIWGANQQGVISSFSLDRAVVTKLEVGMTDATLSGFLIFDCSDITDRSLTYYEGGWTPAFATWSTAPTVNSARYIRVGRLITVFLNFNDGVCLDGSTITGLPFAASSTVGGTAVMSSGDVTKRFTATIITSGTSIIHIPAQTLTGVFCQLTATYFAA